MPSLEPQQGAFLRDLALTTLRREFETTCKVIEAVPVDKGDYRPDTVAMSAMDLAWHIASAENMFLRGVVAGAFDFNFTRPDSVKNSADVLAWYKDAFEANYQKLSAASGQDLVRITDFRGRMQLPAVMFLTLEMHHSVHHRGQLSTYLRSMGSKVPAIYGESYDSRQAAGA